MNTITVNKYLLALLLTASNLAQASVSLSFGPMAADGYGDVFGIGVMISGLGDASAPALGGYDLDISFDANHLAFIGAEFGDNVGYDYLDLNSAGGNPSAVNAIGPGIVNLYEISLDAVEDLNNLQADNFLLAILHFQVLHPGNSQLDIAINALSDAEGNALSATVSSTPISTVPLPSAFWLAASALAGLIVNGKRKA